MRVVSIRICSGRIAVHSPADGEDSRAKYANSLHTGDMLLLAREYLGKTKTALRGMNKRRVSVERSSCLC